MKKKPLSISRAEVLEEVELSSAYRDVKSRRSDKKSGEMAMGAEDRRIANWFFDDMVGRVLTSLRAFARGVINNDEKFEVVLEIPDSLTEDNLDSMRASLKRRMVQGILWRWLDLAGLPEADRCQADAAIAMQEILSFLYHREAPRRRSLH